MATATLIPVEEYLRTSYSPDCDYVDGEVRERLWGEGWHAATQSCLSSFIMENRKAWNVLALPSQRVRISPTRYRVADICVIERGRPFEEIPTRPPLLCIEILESTDRFSGVLERCEDYAQMGVPNVWIIDSRSREIWMLENKGRPVSFTGMALTLPNTLVRVPVREIFTYIDEAPQE